MNYRSGAAIALLWVLCSGAGAASVEADDPLESARWQDMVRTVLDGAPVTFDHRVQVIAPQTAEDPLQVPVMVDARGLAGVEEVVVFADFNPITEVLRFYPEAAQALLGFRVKLQQTTPVRAAARTADGVWHVGGIWVDTVGGGCSAPSAGSASTEWQSILNEVSGRQWPEGANAGRVRLRIVHPMDTGLVAGTPAFHLEEVEVYDDAGRRLLRLRLFEPVSENPVFTLQRLAGRGPLEARGRDNNGNTFTARIAP